MATTYRSLALRKALTQVGIKESPAGSNRGARVEEYQKADSLPGVGYSWCASFVNWCYAAVGRPLNELNRSASVGELLGLARRKGWVRSTPRVGDLVCYDWDSLDGPNHGDWPDHIGIVKEVHSDGSFIAVEGNTAVGNDSNGGEVMLRSRSRSMVEGFVRVPGGFTLVKKFRVYKDGKVVGTYQSEKLARVVTRLRKAKVKVVHVHKEAPNA